MKTSATLKKSISGNLAVAIFFFGTLIFSEKATAQNLIVNPGFENGTTGWSTECSVEINPENVYGGNGSNPVTEIDIERCFNQEVSVSAGSIYDFGFKASRRQGGTPATVGVTVTVTGMQTGTQYVNTNYTYTNTSWSYTTETGSFVVPANSADTKVNIKFANYLTSGTYGTLVDDISLNSSTIHSVLPVKLISFKGEVKNGKSLLEWSASNDDNDGKYFIVERSSTQGSFDSIGIISVSSVTGTRSYSFVDNSTLNGTNSYRLKIVNKAGASYSKVISLDAKKKTASQVYPNPATNVIGFRMNSSSKETVTVQVYSVAGSIVLNKLQELNNGSNNISLDITSLQSGSFFIKIADNSGMSYVQSFCKK